MHLRDLQFFVSVAETGSFRKAAVLADVTQPAVTKGIRRLEQELGIVLLERSRQGTQLSEAGRVFLRRATRLRNELNEALREAHDLRSRAQGLLRVGVAPSLVPAWFGRAAAVFGDQRPAARFSLKIALSDELFSALRRGELDLVLSTLPDPPDPGFDVRPIGSSRLMVVAAESHPALAQAAVGLPALVPFEWVLPRRGVLARDWIDGVFSGRGLPLPVVRIEISTQTDALLPLLVGTDLLSISTAATVSAYLTPPIPARGQGGALVAVPLAELAWRRHIGALTRADQPPSPLLERFLDVVEALAAGDGVPTAGNPF